MEVDLCEQQELLEDVSVAEAISNWPYFDPIFFNQLHRPLTLIKYRLDADTLHDHAVMMTALRKQLMRRPRP